MDDDSTFILKSIARGPSYVQLISNPRIFTVPPIPRGPFICISIFILEGQYPREPLYVSLFSCPRGIGGAANTPGGFICLSTSMPKGYWHR